MDKASLLSEMDGGFTKLNTYLDGLSDEQMTVPTDAAGWTGKDHLMHLAVWAGSMLAVIDQQPRWEAMGVSKEVWKTIVETYDQINAVIQQKHRDLPLAAVKEAFQQTHHVLVERVRSMSDEALLRPYSYYQPWAVDETDPLYAYLQGNTSDHYEEHQAYIAAIVGQ
jgi:hypothetical protein